MVRSRIGIGPEQIEPMSPRCRYAPFRLRDPLRKLPCGRRRHAGLLQVIGLEQALPGAQHDGPDIAFPTQERAPAAFALRPARDRVIALDNDRIGPHRLAGLVLARPDHLTNHLDRIAGGEGRQRARPQAENKQYSMHASKHLHPLVETTNRIETGVATSAT